MKGVLFARKYPACLSRDFLGGLAGSVQSVFGRGKSEKVAGCDVTFFFPGFGKRIRKIPQSVVDCINAGQITDVVDFGAAGALDCDMQVGDVVFSTAEICSDDGWTFYPSCRPNAQLAAMEIAVQCGFRFFEGPILTSSKIVARRAERLALKERFGAIAVQMEHAWFVRELENLVNRDAFTKLCFTHIELICDAVPANKAGFLDRTRNLWRALNICLLSNDYHLGRYKAQFLREFLRMQSSAIS